MRLVFAGTPEFAATALAALLDAGHAIALVLTQPDRPTGRGLKLAPSAVKVLAERRGLAIAQPPTLRDKSVQDRLQALNADALVVAAYGQILPESVLKAPRLGAINIHASLLPRWRGAAPIQRAILAGDRLTGISIMQMDRGLDTGPILVAENMPIAAEDTGGSLHDKLAALGARLIVTALADLAAGRLVPRPQQEDQACYAPKIAKSEAAIDWQASAHELERKVRAFDPAPGTVSLMHAAQVKVWKAEAVPGSGEPGTVLATGPEGIVVACGQGALCLRELQRPGGKRLAARQFLAGFALAPGDNLNFPHAPPSKG